MASSLFLLAACLQSSVTAVVGARIEIGDGTVIDKGTVLMREGAIEEVGENVSVPTGAEVIDGKGLTIYPGFIDGYTTRGLKLPDPPARKTPPDTRNTAPPTMWKENRRGIRADLDASKLLEIDTSDWYSQGVLSAVVAPGGGSIRGSAAFVIYTDQKDRQVLRPNMAMEMGFRSAAGGGGGPGGGGGGGGEGYPGSLLGIIALTRQTLYDAQTYSKATPEKEEDRDPVLAALGPLVAGQVPALWAADTEREIGRALQIGEEFGFKVMLTGARDAYRIAPDLKSKNVTIALNLNAGLEPVRSNDPKATDPIPQPVLDERYQQWLDRAQGAAVLQQSGVPFTFGSEGDSQDDFLVNIRSLIARGFPRDAALRTLTSSAAAILGVGDKLGTIQKGKLANLTVMDGDFAQEKTKVKMVFVLGRKTEVK
ncbi:MAG: amidohydrolase family protein [Fimbriimonadaceae bacterium]|nr:amidohydrolase family protein [Fimbriimonadaceae bacterium]